MNLPIVLVFVLNILGTHSHCDWFCQALIQNGKLWNNDDTSMEDNCTCVPIHKCYLEDVSTQYNCINTEFNTVVPNLVCCRRPVRSSTLLFVLLIRPKTITNIQDGIPSLQPSTQVPSLTSTQRPITNSSTQISPVTNTDCTCMPLSDCYDEDVGSNSQHKQGSCPNPSDVCCIGLVQKVTTPQPKPQPPKPSQISTQGLTFDTSPRPQLPSPAQPSPSADTNCICTPFFKCYDQETSSNLTNVVNDRIHSVRTMDLAPEWESCPDPNDICCVNLVKITAKPTIDSSSVDCSGSCVLIKECPTLLNKLSKAQSGNKDAVQELRKSVCSNTNGILNVCCPPEAEGGAIHPA